MSPTFSPISLGGVSKATVTSTTGSPTIDTSSRPGKTIYKFTGSGSMTFATAGTVEVMVVGGGAAGGQSIGGGGAGGYTYNQYWYVNTGAYTVTVSAGMSDYVYNHPMNYGSSFSKQGTSSLMALGGGRPGYDSANAFNVGGSGSGGQPSTYSGTEGLYGQGYNGGQATAGYTAGAGGGGAGGNGTNQTLTNNSSNGTGGIGIQNSITGTATYYAGGGGGGGFQSGAAGGQGGGGAGGSYLGGSGSVNAVSGTANTGGGGGGRYSGTNSSGGSGYVVVVTG